LLWDPDRSFQNPTAKKTTPGMVSVN